MSTTTIKNEWHFLESDKFYLLVVPLNSVKTHFDFALIFQIYTKPLIYFLVYSKKNDAILISFIDIALFTWMVGRKGWLFQKLIIKPGVIL